MHGDDVAVLNTKVVAHNTVDTGTSIIEIIISEDNENGILPLLALHQNCITPEELESLHRVVRQGNDRVVIVGGIRDAVDEVSASASHSISIKSMSTHIKELGFFFFLRIAVEVSSSCRNRQSCSDCEAVTDSDLLVLSARGIPRALH